MVRSTLPHCRGNHASMCELFGLTPDGLERILCGGDWQPSYSTREEDYCVLEPRTRPADDLKIRRTAP